MPANVQRPGPGNGRAGGRPGVRLLPVAVLAAWAVVPLVTACDVNCDACRQGAGIANNLATLPRMSMGGATVSNDWSTYNVLDCSQASSSDPCQFIDFTTQASESGTRVVNSSTGVLTTVELAPFEDYMSAVGSYVLLGLLLAALSAAWGACLFIQRFTCCCVFKHGGCGGRYPTMMSGKRGLGFHNHKWMVKKTLHEKWMYRKGFVRCCRLCMVVYTIVVLVAFGIGLSASQTFESDVEAAFLFSPMRTVEALARSQGSWTFALRDLGQDVALPLSTRMENRLTDQTDIEAMKRANDRVTEELNIGISSAASTIELVEDLDVQTRGMITYFSTTLPDFLVDWNASLVAIDPFIHDLRGDHLKPWRDQRQVVQARLDATISRLATQEQLFLKLVDPPTQPAEVAFRLNSTLQTLPETLFVFNVVFGPVELCPNLTLLESATIGCADNTTVVNGTAATSNSTAQLDISLTNLIAGNMTGPSDDAVNRRALLEEGLLSIQEKFDTTINIQETTNKLATYKSYVDEAWATEAFFPSAVADFNHTLHEIRRLLPFDAINGSLWPLEPVLREQHEQTTGRLRFLTWRQVMELWDMTLTTIPAQQIPIANESIIVDEWNDALAQATSLNSTAILVPACYDNMARLATGFPAAVAAFMATTTAYQANVTKMEDAFEEQLQVWNSFFIALNHLEAATRDVVDFKAVELKLLPVELQREEQLLEEAIAASQRMGAAITRPEVLFTQAEVDQYQDLFDITENTRNVLVAGIEALHDFSTKRCDVFGKIGFKCTQDLDCLGGTCLAGLPRCRKLFSRTCDNDNQCPQSDNCLFHRPTFENLLDVLADYAVVGKPESSTQVAAMAVLNDTLTWFPPIASGRLTNFSAALSAAHVDAEIAALDQLEADVESNPPLDTIPIAAIRDAAAYLTDVASTLDPAPSLAAAHLYQDERELVLATNQSQRDCDVWADNLLEYVGTYVPAVIPRLDAGSLDGTIDEQGLNGGLDALADMLDGLFEWATINCDVEAPLRVHHDLAWLRQRFEGVTSPRFDGTGALSQWTRMVLSDADLRFVPVDDLEDVDIRGGGIQLDRFGNRYPPHPDVAATNRSDAPYHRLCMAETCVQETLSRWKQSVEWAGYLIDFELLGAVLQAAQAQFTGDKSYAVYDALATRLRKWFSDPDDGHPKLNADRSLIQSVALVFPLLVVLSAVTGALAFCKSCRKWQRWPEACAATFMFVLMVAAFLFAGAVWLPVTIVAHDACASAENVGLAWVRGSSEYLCHSWLHGRQLVGGSVCVMDVYGHELHIDLPKAYQEFVGQCPERPTDRSPATELDRTYIQMGTILPAVIHEQFDKYFDDMGRTCRPDAGLTTDLQDATTRAAEIVDDLFAHITKGLGADAYLHCEPANAALVGMKDDVCCNVVSSMAYLTFVWYLVGLATCVCGAPAAILGYKRFPNQLWGPGFNPDGTDFTPLGDTGAAVTPVQPKDQVGDDVEDAKARPVSRGSRGRRGRRGVVSPPPTPASRRVGTPHSAAGSSGGGLAKGGSRHRIAPANPV